MQHMGSTLFSPLQQLEGLSASLSTAGVVSMAKVVKLNDEDLLSIGVVSPKDRMALLESIASINSLNSEATVDGALSYTIRDTKDPKLMRDVLAIVSKLFQPKRTRHFRVVVERVRKVRNEPLSLAFKRHLKTLSKGNRVVQRVFFPPTVDKLAEHKDNDKVVTEDMLLSAGLRTMLRAGNVVQGQGIYFPGLLSVHENDVTLFRAIVCDVALGDSATYNNGAKEKNESSPPPTLGAGVLDSVLLEKMIPSKGNAAMKDDLVIRLPQQAVPRYVVSFRVHSASTSNQILVVSADGSGDHRGIAEALDAADSGDLIVLRPGTYCESLTIDADVHIVTGAAENSVIDGRIVVASSCQLTGVWVAPQELDEGQACITIQRGSPTFSECDISGMISVEADAQLVVRESRIHHSSGHGILVGQRATCLVEQCTVDEIAKCGVQVEGGARGIIMDSSISACQQNGIYLLDGAKGVIEGCNIFSNVFPGIAVNCADPVIARNRIHHNDRSGLVIAGRSEGNTLVEDNNVFENGRDGIMVAKDAVCLLQGNSVFENKGAGIQVMTGGFPTITKTRIFSNHDSGLVLSKGANATIRNSQIFSNARCGVSVARSGTEGAAVEDCEIFSNGSSGVEVLAGVQGLRVFHCRIFEHCQNVVISKGASILLEKNEIFKGNTCAMWVHAEAEPTAIANIIHSNAALFGAGGRELDLAANNEIL